jgi:hypothetical protein|tara:strand:- start:221 stop:388 length:168 start_codon:yes stop_codon:yes gene_type:complete
MRMNIKEATLEELEDECINVMGTPYGHNIIGIICSEAEKRFGKEEAKRLFELYQV